MLIFVLFSQLLVGCATNKPWTTIYAGGNSSFAINRDGSLWGWGCNNSGQLGESSNDYKYIPDPIKIMEDVIAVSAGANHTAAIKADRSLWVWGRNWFRVRGGGENIWNLAPLRPERVMSNVATVSVGLNHTMAITTDGRLWGWGANEDGQLGVDVTSKRYSLPQSMGRNGSGTEIFGSNDYLQITENAVLEKFSPTPVEIMDNVAYVSAGDNFTMAIKTDGSLWAWGRNNNGQLGDGTTITGYAPIRILDDVDSVSAGRSFVMAIKSDGSLWTWGNNSSGQLGNGTTIEQHSPGKIMDDVRTISAGSSHAMAITTDGRLWGWGRNYGNKLGDNMAVEQDSPVSIMSRVADLSVGREHSMILSSDGEILVWGDNQRGQIGDGTITEIEREPYICGFGYGLGLEPFEGSENTADPTVDAVKEQVPDYVDTSLFGLPVTNDRLDENAGADNIFYNPRETLADFFNNDRLRNETLDMFALVRVIESEHWLDRRNSIWTRVGRNAPIRVRKTSMLYVVSSFWNCEDHGVTGSLPIYQNVNDNPDINIANNLLREGGLYLLPLSYSEWSEEWTIMGEHDVLFEVDDDGRVWSHSKHQDFNRFDGENVGVLIGEVLEIAAEARERRGNTESCTAINHNFFIPDSTDSPVIQENSTQFYTELTPEQIRTFDRATFIILRKNSDERYTELYTFFTSSVVELNSDGRLYINFDGRAPQVIIGATGESGIVTSKEVERTDTRVLYEVLTVLQGGGTSGRWLDSTGGELEVELNLQSGDINVLSMNIDDVNTDSLREEQSEVDIFTGWWGIAFPSFARIPSLNSNGSFLPFSEWERPGRMRGFEISTGNEEHVENFGFVVEYLDRNYEYYVLFNIWDIDGNITSSDMLLMELD